MSEAARAIPPGSVIGILGGGQLGRMLAMAAAKLGYHCHVYSPEDASPAGEVSAWRTVAAYDDFAALARFAAAVDVVTYEFENVDAAAVAALAARKPVRPGVRALEVARDRAEEKAFVAGLGGSPAPFRVVDDLAGLEAALAEIGAPAILKTRRFGYDGKGQARIASAKDAAAAWQAIGGRAAVLEAMVAFEAEFSVLVARGVDGRTRIWDVPENEHRDGILHRSVAPAEHPLIRAQAAQAQALAAKVADALDYVGVLTLEFFATPAGPIFNEMAPRVHNSGHWTIEGAAACQFENHIRAICGLPLGDPALVTAGAEMINLIGDQASAWPALFAEPGAHVHLYGKGGARPGRKMGHVTRLR